MHKFKQYLLTKINEDVPCRSAHSVWNKKIKFEIYAYNIYSCF